jgi:hypothetical protein
MEISFNLDDGKKTNLGNFIYGWDNKDLNEKLKVLRSVEPFLRNIYRDVTTIPIYNDKQQLVCYERKWTLDADEKNLLTQIEGFVKYYGLALDKINTMNKVRMATKLLQEYKEDVPIINK